MHVLKIYFASENVDSSKKSQLDTPTDSNNCPELCNSITDLMHQQILLRP